MCPPSRNRVKGLDKSEGEFMKEQLDLGDAGFTPTEAIQMTSQNKIQRVVEQCRKSHDGPITAEEELDGGIQKLEDEESKRKPMIYEISHSKVTLLSIKPSNPLFLQKN